MEKQNVVLIYSIYFPECGNKCIVTRPTLGMSLFIEKKKSFTPLSPFRYACKKSAHNIMCRLNKSDEYLPIWHGALMFGRDKEKLIKIWDEYHRVQLASGAVDFNNDEETLKEVVEDCNNQRSPEIYYNILKVKMQEYF